MQRRLEWGIERMLAVQQRMKELKERLEQERKQ